MLGLVLATQVAAMTPQTQIAPGTYTYTAMLSGANVGTSTVTVKNVNGAMQIDEQASGAMGGDKASANATLQLGADLAPTSYTLTGTNNGSPVKDAATIAGTTATVTNVHGQTQPIDLLASTKHFVVLDFGAFAGFVALPAQMRAWNNAIVLAVVPSIGQSVALIPAATQPTTPPAGVPAGDVAVAFEGQTAFTIWYNPATNIPDQIDVTAQGLTVTRQQ
jgi:hypothetical protein